MNPTTEGLTFGDVWLAGDIRGACPGFLSRYYFVHNSVGAVLKELIISDLPLRSLCFLGRCKTNYFFFLLPRSSCSIVNVTFFAHLSDGKHNNNNNNYRQCITATASGEVLPKNAKQ